MTKTNNQRTYFFFSIITVSIAFLLTHIYRPYVYTHNVNDFGFADTIGSLVSVIGFCFFIWGIKNYSNKEKNLHIIVTMIIYTIVWESISLLGVHGTFDWKDIIAGIVSAIITYISKENIERRR